MIGFRFARFAFSEENHYGDIETAISWLLLLGLWWIQMTREFGLLPLVGLGLNDDDDKRKRKPKNIPNMGHCGPDSNCQSGVLLGDGVLVITRTQVHQSLRCGPGPKLDMTDKKLLSV
jgi:hypothetical protein